MMAAKHLVRDAKRIPIWETGRAIPNGYLPIIGLSLSSVEQYRAAVNSKRLAECRGFQKNWFGLDGQFMVATHVACHGSYVQLDTAETTCSMRNVKLFFKI